MTKWFTGSLARPYSAPSQIADETVTSNQVDFNRLPLSFVPNMGQSNSEVNFLVKGLGGNLFFRPAQVVLVLPNPVKVIGEELDARNSIRYNRLPPSVVRILYKGANNKPDITLGDPLPGAANYLIGDDPEQWITNVPTYSGIVYNELYPGIDLSYEGTEGKLKSTYHISPGADPTLVRGCTKML